MKLSTLRGDIAVSDDSHGETPIVLMHGFPDDSRAYQRLAPLLVDRGTVLFDFLGYGASDRIDPELGQNFDPHDDLAAVVDWLDLDQFILVGHDASGPVAIDFAIENPGRISNLVLFNTYYGNAPELRFPEMIRLFADEDYSPLADALIEDQAQLLWLLQYSARAFGFTEISPDGIAVSSIIPQFFSTEITSDSLTAIRAWTATLFDSLEEQDQHILGGALTKVDVPVSLIFGSGDAYLSPELAFRLGDYFEHSAVHVVSEASHWPQWDQPDEVARILLALSK
jgi:haloalkane dehalogenase